VAPARRRAEVLAGAGGQLRIGPWQGGQRVAYIVPVNAGSPSSVLEVRRALDVLAGRGYSSVVTAALAPLDEAAFLTAGFEVRERLHLLARALPGPPPPDPPAGVTIRRAHAPDRGDVLALDHQAFDHFWRLDEVGLDDAIAATPSARFRVAVTADAETPAVVGYAVVGRASQRGYVQRLAVSPAHHGRGLGRVLLLDGIRWLERRRVRRVMVNTQEHNASALALYEREGFERQPGGLAVLTRSLQDVS
jgi:ribosomal protein S18 acetylase RimI-like enzyme